MTKPLTKEVPLGKDVVAGSTRALVLIAGPCVIESREHALMLGKTIRNISAKAGFPYVFKASYDKANRTSISSYRGPGLEEGLAILAEVGAELGVPVLTDIHTEDQIEAAAQAVDVLQIPAFLCRQTDFILKAAATGKPINIKKGQFLAPWDMKNVVEKAASAGNEKIMLTERGATFGYNNLVSDMRSLAVMRGFGYPVVYDATHSVQLPGGMGGSSGGQREHVVPLARAATATGIDVLFIETHNDPDRAMSDGPNNLPVEQLAELLDQVRRINDVVSG